MKQRVYRHPINNFELLSKPDDYLEQLKLEFVEESKKDFAMRYNIKPECMRVKSSTEKELSSMTTYIYVEIEEIEDGSRV